MANIAITDRWLIDPRRDALAEKVGPLQADGLAVRAWRLGFEYYKNGQALVPHAVFQSLPHAEVFISVGLAESKPEGVYIRGSKDEFRWYEEGVRQRSEAGKIGGRVSAQRPRDAKGRLLPKRDPNETQTEPIKSKPSSSSLLKRKNTTTSTDKAGEEKHLELKAQVHAAFEIWNETLIAFGLPKKPINAVLENSILRAINLLGFETVCLALEGARYEAPGKDFSPRLHLSVDRVLHRDSKGISRWEKFENLALAEREKKRLAEQEQQEAERTA